LARKLLDIGIFSVLTSGSAIGVGWKLNIYGAGGSVRSTTYNAPSAGSANANPVVADANGRFAEIWLTVGASYKYVLTDENDVPKVTVDNLLVSADAPAISAGLLTFLAGSAALPVGSGGTASTTAADALTALGALPKAGGTMTGNITRSGKGVHLYFDTAAMANGGVFLTAAATPDPRGGLPGQVWMKY
jgi:hypothetical protein